jgi:methyl-accepting chemotaxis protein
MKSMLASLRFKMYAFGTFTGLVFPFYAYFFVNWKEGMLPYFALGCIVAGFTIGLVNAIMVNHYLVKQLTQIATLSTRLAAGDLSERLTLESNDEIGEIANQFNAFLDQNERNSLSINRQLRVISDEISKMKEVSEMLNQYVAATDKESLSELVRSIHILNEKNSQAAEHLNNVRGEHKSVSDKLSMLNGSIQIMQGKLKNITSIALNSRLLAMNSAVEAARLGGAGKAFAVVGDEMESLSNVISSIANELISEIAQLEHYFKSSVKAFQNTDTSLESTQGNLIENQHHMNQFSAHLNAISSQISQSSNEIQKSITQFEHTKDQLSTLV